MHRVPPPRHRHHRAPAATLIRPAMTPLDLRRARRLHHLDRVSLQIIAGFLVPLPFIQIGHWAFGWPSIAVMVGGLG